MDEGRRTIMRIGHTRMVNPTRSLENPGAEIVHDRVAVAVNDTSIQTLVLIPRKGVQRVERVLLLAAQSFDGEI